MPTGRILLTGGVTPLAINPVNLPPPIPGIITGTGTDYQDSGPAGTMPAQPNIIPEYGMNMPYYAGFVPEVAKANNIAPSNQGARGLQSAQDGYFPALGVAKPSRSQFSEGYTLPIQMFAASNTWQLAGPVDSPGSRAKQPNQKFVSPFASLPIPTRMPWDL